MILLSILDRTSEESQVLSNCRIKNLVDNTRYMVYMCENSDVQMIGCNSLYAVVH